CLIWITSIAPEAVLARRTIIILVVGAFFGNLVVTTAKHRTATRWTERITVVRLKLIVDPVSQIICRNDAEVNTRFRVEIGPTMTVVNSGVGCCTHLSFS